MPNANNGRTAQTENEQNSVNNVTVGDLTFPEAPELVDDPIPSDTEGNPLQVTVMRPIGGASGADLPLQVPFKVAKAAYGYVAQNSTAQQFIKMTLVFANGTIATVGTSTFTRTVTREVPANVVAKDGLFPYNRTRVNASTLVNDANKVLINQYLSGCSTPEQVLERTQGHTFVCAAKKSPRTCSQDAKTAYDVNIVAAVEV